MGRMPAGPSWNNRDRAESAVAVLAVRAEMRGEEDETLKHQLTDLLADLMHACRYELISFEDCLRRATAHFVSESIDHND